MEFFKVSTEEEALKLSRELYKLTRPNPHPEDVTKFLCEIEELKEGWVVKIPDIEIPISKDADFTELQKYLQVKYFEGDRVKITDIIDTNFAEQDYLIEKKEEPIEEIKK